MGREKSLETIIKEHEASLDGRDKLKVKRVYEKLGAKFAAAAAELMAKENEIAGDWLVNEH